ncbi:MAG: hypothetical protein QOI38_2899, partial [Sphingomonadales bacterium]|nr:hypothetical protein [Sphingomonadales bacterium]
AVAFFFHEKAWNGRLWRFGRRRLAH